MTSLDIDQLRAFTLAADLRSFTAAGESLGATQSAVSLRIGKLESALGVRLLARTPRSVALTPEGRRFLEQARSILELHDRVLADYRGAPARRRVRLALSDHAVGPDLAEILRRLRQLLPGIVPEVEMGFSSAMRERFAAGEADAAIVRQDAGRMEGRELFEEALLWAAAEGFEPEPGAPVPLVVLDGPCGVRSAAVRALEEAGLPWRVAFLGRSVSALIAAMQAGLGIMPLAASHLPEGCAPVAGLPALPRDRIVLHTRLEDPTRRLLISAVRAAHAARRNRRP
ncbi:MAG TPA: LysR family transcriptional regulator [Azospirillaceae bacterium]|nr:LysR family transcriptional regulator [Azospirillaceae bacterium]